MEHRESHCASCLVLVDPLVVRYAALTLTVRRQYRTESCRGVSVVSDGAAGLWTDVYS